MTDDDRELEAARKDPRQLELPFHSKIEWLCSLTVTDKELAEQLSPGPK